MGVKERVQENFKELVDVSLVVILLGGTFFFFCCCCCLRWRLRAGLVVCGSGAWRCAGGAHVRSVVRLMCVRVGLACTLAFSYVACGETPKVMRILFPMSTCHGPPAQMIEAPSEQTMLAAPPGSVQACMCTFMRVGCSL